MIETAKVDEFRQRLSEYLEAVTGQPVDVEKLQVLFNGAAQESWLVKVEINDAEQSFVLQRDLPFRLDDKALDCDQEFRVMKLAHEASVSIPKPRWYCLESLILDQPFFITEYVEGISSGDQVVSLPELAEARTALPVQMGEQLAKIHAIDPSPHKFDFLPHPRTGFSPAQETIAQIRAMILRLGVHNPVFDFGLRWAEQNVPKTSKTVFLHGDFRLGNLLVGKKGLTGIIGWEFARMGDPLEDLAWPCLRHWRYGKGELQLGGIGKREPFIQAYEKASGQIVDRQALDYWEILANLRWAVSYQSQANRNVSGAHPSVEFANRGRRSAEMQLEMLRLIGAKGLKDDV
jgi:aminoglycoside phosphotransferase (APT) family kinase protein